VDEATGIAAPLDWKSGPRTIGRGAIVMAPVGSMTLREMRETAADVNVRVNYWLDLCDEQEEVFV
jgi:hypothetical protein